MAFFAVEEFFAYIAESYTAGVIESNLEQSPLIQQHDQLEDFTKFDNNDTIFQEYDPPPGDDSKMGWKRSRPAKWWMSLWKAVKCVFCIQILGGFAVGSLAIAIIVLDFNSTDLCFDSQSQNWTALPGKIQAIIVSGETVESYVVQLWAFFLVITMFGWPLVKKLNLLSINLLGAFFDTCYRLYLQIYGVYEKSWMPFPLHALFLIMVLINSTLVGREFANNSAETERYTKLLKVSSVLAAHMVFGIPIAYSLIYGLIPLYSRVNEIHRLAIATAFPLVTVIPKIIVRLAVQRIDFLHPGESHVLVSSMYSTFRIVFRGMQAELSSLKLFILLSFVHGSVDLLERLTIIFRDYFWYFIYRKLKRDTNAEAMLSASKRRTARSMRFIADMSVQMILGESTALIAAVGLTQLHSFMYNNDNDNSPSFIRDMYLIADFFVRVSIALTIDLLFNSFSVWLQMSYFNIAVVRVWKKKWRKHVVVGLILTSLTMCYFTTHLFAIVKVKHSDKHTSRSIVRHFNCTGPFSKF